MGKVLLVVLLIANILALILYGLDKYRAVRHKWRIPESVLIGIAVCGGSVGALIGMFLFHHKTKKPRFRIGVPLILICQVVVLILLRKWF